MVSIAIPASCIGSQTCYSLTQATYTLYEICRACVLFDVKEIIVYDVGHEAEEESKLNGAKKITFDEGGASVSTKIEPSWEAVMCTNMLQFFVTPPYLRKQIFGDLKPFKLASKLPKIPGLSTSTQFIEGITVKREGIKKKGKKTKKQRADAKLTTFVNVGFDRLYELEEAVPLHNRVVVDVKTGKAVASDTADGAQPYTVRAADQFSKIFTESTVEGGYTSAYCVPTQAFASSVPAVDITSTAPQSVRKTPAPLLVFGKWAEMSAAIRSDKDLDAPPESLFDELLAGVEKARLEDGVMITLGRAYSQ